MTMDNGEQNQIGFQNDQEETKSRIEEVIREQQMHRSGDQEGPFSIHILGLGKTGASVIEQLLLDPPEGFLQEANTSFSALAVDIGDEDLRPVREAAEASGLPAERLQVRTAELEVPTRDELFGSLRRYREYLKIEFPRYYWNPNYEPWLTSDVEVPGAGEHFPRAIAKAIYGRDYYEGRAVAEELDAFAGSVDASGATSIVFVVFSLTGGTGSGIVVDVARHLSSIKLGRRQLVVGLGVLPCDSAPEEAQDGTLFPVLNELDCMLDQEKNQGVMAVWGDLYKNPFTGGFFVVPQNGAYELTKDLAKTHEYVNEGIVDFIARDNGLHVYETLKLLNWLNSPAARYHPAMRAEFTDRWVNILASRKMDDAGSIGVSFELANGLRPEYVEARVFAPSGEFGTEVEAKIGDQIASAVSAVIEPGVLHFDTDSHPFIHVDVPRATKVDLAAFAHAREVYDQLEWEEKLMRHSWLLDLGVMLCEPSIRFEGMGGECIWGCACWVVVPYDAIRGEVEGVKI